MSKVDEWLDRWIGRCLEKRREYPERIVKEIEWMQWCDENGEDELFDDSLKMLRLLVEHWEESRNSLKKAKGLKERRKSR